MVGLASLALAGCQLGPPIAAAPGPRLVVAEAAPEPAAPTAAAECAELAAAAAWTQAAAVCDRVPAAERAIAGLAEPLAVGYLAEGRAALSKGDVARALTWFERAYLQRPDSREAAREYVLALAYRGGEAALAAGDWNEALAKFQAVHEADRLYLTWLPQRAPRRRQAEVHVAWGQALVAERLLDDAEQHCQRAEELAPELPAASECLAAVLAARPPTPTPTPTATPTPVRRAVPARPPAPPRPVAPPAAAPVPRPAAPPTPASLPRLDPAPAAPVFGAPVN
jgi:tetratricopeptide (TPR) repeat protein